MLGNHKRFGLAGLSNVRPGKAGGGSRRPNLFIHTSHEYMSRSYSVPGTGIRGGQKQKWPLLSQRLQSSAWIKDSH